MTRSSSSKTKLRLESPTQKSASRVRSQRSFSQQRGAGKLHPHLHFVLNLKFHLICAPSSTAVASISYGDDQNDVEEITTTANIKRRRFITTSQQQTQTSPSSSNHPQIMPPGDSLHAPPPTLPFELIIDILSRLPVKFLLQLKSVCKSWKTLISDPQFAKKHISGTNTPHNLILSFANPSREFLLRSYSLFSIFNNLGAGATQLAYPLNNRNRFDFIVGSCDGMLCFAINQNYALLWNPSIRKSKKLPSLENQKQRGSYTIYGFGYDHFSDNYKVVAVFCYDFGSTSGTSSYKTEVKVHTLGADCWRRIQEFPSGVPFDESGKFVSGTLNWLASGSPSSWVIVSLDLGNESYQELLQPDYGGVAVVTLTLAILRDCLCILAHSNTFSDVWLMKDYGNEESWTKLFRVPYMGNPNSFPYTKALCISEDDAVLLECQSKLVVYESRNGTFNIPDIQDIHGWVVPEVYVESLISPCS